MSAAKSTGMKGPSKIAKPSGPAAPKTNPSTGNIFLIRSLLVLLLPLKFINKRTEKTNVVFQLDPKLLQLTSRLQVRLETPRVQGGISRLETACG